MLCLPRPGAPFLLLSLADLYHSRENEGPAVGCAPLPKHPSPRSCRAGALGRVGFLQEALIRVSQSLCLRGSREVPRPGDRRRCPGCLCVMELTCTHPPPPQLPLQSLTRDKAGSNERTRDEELGVLSSSLHTAPFTRNLLVHCESLKGNLDLSIRIIYYHNL